MHGIGFKEELVDFCRQNKLPVSGGKIELTERIAYFLDTEKIKDACVKRKAAKIVTHADCRGWGYATECLDYAKNIAKQSECHKLSVVMDKLIIVDLKYRQEIKEKAAEWFHRKWGVPEEAYIECMEDYITGKTKYGWYLCLDSEKIVAGLGVIENDFHDRKDLAPNICAVYTEEEYRNQGVAGKLLDYAVRACKANGIEPLYLVTGHTGFYEKYGWEFLCMVHGDGEPEMSRMYIHR